VLEIATLSIIYDVIACQSSTSCRRCLNLRKADLPMRAWSRKAGLASNMLVAAAKTQDSAEKKEKVELWQNQMEELDKGTDGLYEEGKELSEAAKQSGHVTK
jgi:hypothetical protein